MIGIDNALAASLQSHELRARVVTFGFDARAAIRASACTFAELGSRFELSAGDRRLGMLELRVPGAMNVQNALAAVAVARELDVPFEAIARALREFRGVRRRFDILVSNQRATIVDDYAHHPTAVRATISAARAYHDGELIVAFQPHRYSRTAFLAKDFANALREADRIYLTPVYSASEPAIPGVSERSIGDVLAATGADVRYVECVENLESRVHDELPQGAMVLMLGAGNITEIASRLAERVAREAHRPAPVRA